MTDVAHLETDAIILAMEKKLRKEYKAAVKETEKKLLAYMLSFVKNDAVWKARLLSGDAKMSDYVEWRKSQIAVGKRWEDMKDALAKDYHNANMIAKSIVLGYMPEVYALNYNYGTYQLEHDYAIDTSFTLYSRETVEHLMRDNPTLIPPPGKRLAKRIAEKKDILWNKQQLQSLMMQSILQGESIPKIAKRICTTMGERNYHNAVRSARTMATSAQNAGRQAAYTRVASKGPLKLRKTWVATLDDRTRHAHRELDGQTVDVDKPFEVDGYKLMSPGDMSLGAPGYLIYNCRCTTVGQIEGFERDTTAYRTDPGYSQMSYEEWKKAKPVYKKKKGNNGRSKNTTE